MRKTNKPRPPATEVQRQQHKLWQESGSLARLVVNLASASRSCELISDKLILRDAIGVINSLQTANRYERKNLPNKKKLAAIVRSIEKLAIQEASLASWRKQNEKN